MIKKAVLMALVALLGVSLVGCVGKVEGPGVKNQDPTVWLSSAPPEGTVSNYTLHLYWGGWDPDGEIRHYEWIVTNNESGVFNPADTTGAGKWHRVTRNDSTFTFTADQLADSADADPNNLEPIDFIRSHTFFVRAVDDHGLASKKPAYRSFTSRTLSPVVDISVPTATGSTPAQVPPISTFQWIGKDYISNEREQQDPDSVRWILLSTRKFDESWGATLDYIIKNPKAEEWSDWRYYKALGDSGKFWTTPALDFGPYMFAVQVKDEAGAVSAVFDQDRNVRRVLVSTRLTGPVLKVYNKYIGTIITSTPTTPPVIIDMPANIPMEFRFSADARSYGGVASGYRYGWDIQDLNDPTQWEIDYTPFTREVNDVPTAESPPRAWQFDSHTFYIEVMDNSGYTSRVPITVNVVPFTMQKNVLLVDDWKEKSPGLLLTNGAVPSDAEHDAFWADSILADVKGFDPAVDVIQIEDEIPITAFSDYKSVIWVATAAFNAKTASFINNVLRFVDPTAPASTGKTTPNIVALFMSAGGHMLLCGEQIMAASLNRQSFAPLSPTFPIIFRYELGGDQDGDYEDSNVGERGVGEQSFGYQDCCVNVMDIAYISVRNSIRRPQNQGCPVNTIRPAPHKGRDDGLRVALPLDDKYTFPTLTLRDEVGGVGRWFSEDRNGLNCDIYDPPYFADVPKGGTSQGTCNDVAELVPPRDCFKPIYGNGCLSLNSKIYNAPVAFWTTVYEDRVPEAGGVGARSAVMGFHPFYFKPHQVKQAIDIILFKEWQLPRK